MKNTIDLFAKKIYYWLSNKKDYNLEDKLIIHTITLYIYDIFTFSIILFFGILFDMIFITLIYIFIFSSVRERTGGYHFNTHLKCIFFYIMIYLIYIYILNNINLTKNILLILFSFNIFLLSIFTPVQHVNHPLSLDEYNKNRIKCIKILITYSALQLCFFVFNFDYFFYVITIIFCIITILVLVQRFSKYYKENNYDI